MQSTENKKFVPLRRVVNAAIIDMYGDIGQWEQSFTHWAARGLRKLQEESLRFGIRRVLLPINPNTRTATLPCDFDSETFVGLIDKRGRKVPLRVKNDLVLIQDVDVKEDKCPYCSQDKNLCRELSITEDSTIVEINNNPYVKKVVKKMLPNGDFYVETITPVYDLKTSSVIYITDKEFKTKIDLRKCGCVKEAQTNLDKIKAVCPDAYYAYCCPCEPVSINHGGYQIFEEQGLIQFDLGFRYDKAYIEYWGFLPKVNGQYQVPYVCFEALVEWTKWKSIANRIGVEQWRIRDQFDSFVRERGNMEIKLGRISLSIIIDAIGLIPKFDLEWNNPYDCSVARKEIIVIPDECDIPAEEKILTIDGGTPSDKIFHHLLDGSDDLTSGSQNQTDGGIL